MPFCSAVCDTPQSQQILGDLLSGSSDLPAYFQLSRSYVLYIIAKFFVLNLAGKRACRP